MIDGMNSFHNGCLDIISKNLFAIQTLYNMDIKIDGWDYDYTWIRISMYRDSDHVILPNSMSSGIKSYYSQVFKRDWDEEEWGKVEVDCNYDVKLGRFDLYIRKSVDKGKKYILNIDGGSLTKNCRWELTLKDEEIERIKYLKKIDEESVEKFGNFSGLDLSFSVTFGFNPEDKDLYTTFEVVKSRVLYVGNDEFIVRCDLILSTGGDQYFITTERFKI